MGCCMSTSATEKSSALGHQMHQFSEGPRSDGALESRAPPPVDEETVKEVLSVSETPRHKPVLSSPPPPHLMPFTKPQEHEIAVDQDQEKRAQEPVFEKKTEEPDPEKIEQKIPIYSNNGEISEVSEICSLSESMSTTTITRDDDEEVHQRLNRSPLKLRQNRGSSIGQSRDRVVGKSPNRRAESSPGRRYGKNDSNGGGSVRLVKSGEPGPGQQPMSRRGSRAESNRRDPGESSGRRSRSPATRVTDGGGVSRANVGRSPSARRSGRYLARTAVGPVESSGSTRRGPEEPKTEERKWATANESIDNPLVSLECFIFL